MEVFTLAQEAPAFWADGSWWLDLLKIGGGVFLGSGGLFAFYKLWLESKMARHKGDQEWISEHYQKLIEAERKQKSELLNDEREAREEKKAEIRAAKKRIEKLENDLCEKEDQLTDLLERFMKKQAEPEGGVECQTPPLPPPTLLDEG